ncbi:hypothetical protein NSS70_04380 [Aeribacillus sp. FSL K6-2848]|uniref:hypothetical protein n=1 Tax=Aeribacillus sp. FSL K6-2848 TaxID=2954612 RepID=UPI0030F798B8
MLNDHIKRTTREIDAFLENYTIGILIVDGDSVSLEAKSGEILLDETYVIEVFAGGKYHPITYDQARNTMSRDGWPLYAGLEARVKKGGGGEQMKNMPSAYDFEKLTEAIAFYTRKVAEVTKNRDRDMHNEVMRFKKELHERIDREYDPAAL